LSKVEAMQALILDHALSAGLHMRFAACDAALQEFTTAGQAIKECSWAKEYGLKSMLQKSNELMRSFHALLLSSWLKQTEMQLMDLRKVDPADWEHWAVQCPDKDKIMKLILFSGSASVFSEKFTSGGMVYKSIKELDPLIENKFSAKHQELLIELEKLVGHCEILVSVTYAYKYVFIKFPEMPKEMRKQSVRDVRRKLAGTKIPAEVISQLSMAAK
jgi:hypothetical protein